MELREVCYGLHRVERESAKALKSLKSEAEQKGPLRRQRFCRRRLLQLQTASPCGLRSTKQQPQAFSTHVERECSETRLRLSIRIHDERSMDWCMWIIVDPRPFVHSLSMFCVAVRAPSGSDVRSCKCMGTRICSSMVHTRIVLPVRKRQQIHKHTRRRSSWVAR